MTELEEKQMKVIRLFGKVLFPFPFVKFFDLSSDKLLDEKLDVLEALKEGKTISEIPEFYKVLELMPKDGIWD